MGTSVHPDAILGPRSLSARLLGHPAVLLGGPRALLLQVAHPLVAAGVVQHSTFERDPYTRLARTFAVMHEIAFGSPRCSAAAAARLAAVHRRVRGVAPDGTPYAAGDPELALWVHATLVDTLLVVEQRYVGELDDGGRDRLYAESCRLAAPLGVPPALVPTDRRAFRAYMVRMEEELLARGVGEDARRIAAHVLHPPPAVRLGPLGPLGARAAARMVQAVTVDLGPRALCRAYGLPEQVDAAAVRHAVALAAGASRLVSPRLPGVVRDPATLVRLTARLARAAA